MTATSYVDLDNDDLGANKILRAATMSALDTNPVSIAQRGPSAPWLNGVGAIEAITAGSGNWTVPTGVYRIKATAVGGGGGGYSGSGSTPAAGGDTTFSTITGGGGSGGSSAGGGSGGSSTGGTLNITGGNGCAIILTGGVTTGSGSGGGSTNGFGGTINASSIGGTGSGYGGGGGGGVGVDGGGGGGGGTAIKVFSVEPGDLIAYAVGSGGSAGTSSGAGTAGIIIIEY